MADLSARDQLPRYLAPLPRALEEVAFRFVWVIVAVNLIGTAFGFWYYGFHPFSSPVVVWQFAAEPVVMWPFVPDSPMATLFIAASLAAWKLDRQWAPLDALAFFGCIKLGLWTPFVLLAFKPGFADVGWPMYNFLFWSHLAMVAQAFLIHRYSDFALRGVAVATAWYLVNDIVDYLLPVVGTPHHTLVPPQRIVDGQITHVSPAHELAGAAAIALTVIAVFLALATRIGKLEARRSGGPPDGA